MSVRAKFLVLALLGSTALVGCGPEPPPANVEYESDELIERAERSPGHDGLTPEDVERLGALPYLGGYEPAPDETGVVVHVPERTVAGANLVLSGHAAEASLLDMEGKVLHRWRKPMEELWPERAARGEGDHWRRAHLADDGELLAIYEGVGIVCLDARSQVLWSWEGNCHHDLFVEEDGTIHVLTRRAARIDVVNPREAVLEDGIAVLDPNGEVLGECSVLRAMLNSEAVALLRRSSRRGDVLHTNTVQLLETELCGDSEYFRPGHYLVSMPFLDTIAVVDPVAERFTHWWTGTEGGLFRMQHDPILLSNGAVLLFDNLGAADGSKVIEFHPADRSIGWSFSSRPGRPFSSIRLGANQRLENGNTLIVESVRGRALEVTRDGTIVWEYVNPHTTGAGSAMLESFVRQAEQAERLWNAEHVEQIRAQLELAQEGELAATLLDVVRYPDTRVIGWTWISAPTD